MYQNYNTYYQPQTQGQMRSQAQAPQFQNMFGLKGRPVSSLEEVRATGIDFDGSVFFFPDLANKKIYTKQINMDGTASLNMYELKSLPEPIPQDNSSYITREEFEAALAQLRASLNAAPVTEAPISQPADSVKAAKPQFNF